MKSVLITGANGYIGQQLLSQLALLNIPITALSRRPIRSHTSKPMIHWVKENLLAPQKLNDIVEEAKASHLIHLAWCTQFGKYWQSEENSQWVKASMQLVRSFVEAGGEHVLISGSCAEYDWSSGYCKEGQTPLVKNSAYAASKNELHFLLRAYLSQKKIPLAWARIFFSFGPNEPPQKLCSSIALKLLIGEKAVCKSGWQVKDYLYVKDIADALKHLSQISANDAYNIGSGQGIKIRDLVLKLETALQQHNKTIFSQNSNHGPASVVADTTLLASTGWFPKYTLNEAIAECIHWWKSRVETH